MAATSRLLLIAVLGCVAVGNALKLPSYLKPCSRNDPNIDECILKNGKISVIQMVKNSGDKKYNIPSLKPLKVLLVNVDQNGLKLKMKDVDFNGLENIVLTASKWDFKTHHVEMALKIPRLEIIFQYEVSGRILVLPIQGSGPANITVNDFKLYGKFDYDLKKGKSGKEHMIIKNTFLDFEKTAGIIRLDNLFGNKELSDNMNLVLNESSEEVISDVGPAVAAALAQVTEQILNGIARVVPFDDYFPETV